MASVRVNKARKCFAEQSNLKLEEQQKFILALNNWKNMFRYA